MEILDLKFRNAGNLYTLRKMSCSTNEVRARRGSLMRWKIAVNVSAVGLPVTNSHNSRFANLSFHIPHSGVLHGLAGYFEAVLYGSVGLSIHPQRKDYVSRDMISWFPIYFPFKVNIHSVVSPATVHYARYRTRCISQGTRNCTYRCGGLRINNGCGMNGTPKRSCR